MTEAPLTGAAFNPSRDRLALAFSGCVPITGSPLLVLADSEPYFRQSLERSEAVLNELAGWSLFDVLHDASSTNPVSDLAHNVPLIVALQIAVHDLLSMDGIRAASAIGMSCGEISSAYAAGVLEHTDALRIATILADIVASKANTLRMALVWTQDRQDAKDLPGFTQDLAVAGRIGPGVFAISGETGALESLIERLRKCGICSSLMPFNWGVHHPSLEQDRIDFEAALGSLNVQTPRCFLASCSLAHGEATDWGTSHWWPTFQRPVLLEKCVRQLIHQGVNTFIDMGPTTSLTSLIPASGGQILSFRSVLDFLRSPTHDVGERKAHEGIAISLLRDSL